MNQRIFIFLFIFMALFTLYTYTQYKKIEAKLKNLYLIRRKHFNQKIDVIVAKPEQSENVKLSLKNIRISKNIKKVSSAKKHEDRAKESEVKKDLKSQASESKKSIIINTDSKSLSCETSGWTVLKDYSSKKIASRKEKIARIKKAEIKKKCRKEKVKINKNKKYTYESFKKLILAKKLKEAEKVYERIIFNDPSIIAENDYGVLKKIIKKYESRANKGKNKESHLMQLAFLYDLSGEIENAVAIYKKVLELSPNNKKALEEYNRLKQDIETTRKLNEFKRSKRKLKEEIEKMNAFKVVSDEKVIKKLQEIKSVREKLSSKKSILTRMKNDIMKLKAEVEDLKKDFVP